MTEQNLLAGATEMPAGDQNLDYLAELVGENKKFKDVKDLAKGKYDSDLYIKVLEKNLDQMRQDFIKEREDNSSKAKLDELIRRMEAARTPQITENPDVNVAEKKPTIDPKEIEQLVTSKVQEIETTRKLNDNFTQVQNKLRERYGDNFPNVLKEQALSLGLTDDDVNALARKSPTAFFRTMGLDQNVKENFTAPPQSSQRNAFQPTGGQKRTWSYYKELKAKNPNAFLDPKINIQMHNDALELGDEVFFDAD